MMQRCVSMIDLGHQAMTGNDCAPQKSVDRMVCSRRRRITTSAVAGVIAEAGQVVFPKLQPGVGDELCFGQAHHAAWEP